MIQHLRWSSQPTVRVLRDCDGSRPGVRLHVTNRTRGVVAATRFVGRTRETGISRLVFSSIAAVSGEPATQGRPAPPHRLVERLVAYRLLLSVRSNGCARPRNVGRAAISFGKR
jgi:hypothetical protein